MRQQSYVLQAFVETPWAILPRQLIILQEIVVRHVSGEKLDAEEVETENPWRAASGQWQ